jgi:hypothetical protein
MQRQASPIRQLRESQLIGYKLLVAFCYRHLLPPNRDGSR